MCLRTSYSPISRCSVPLSGLQPKAKPAWPNAHSVRAAGLSIALLFSVGLFSPPAQAATIAAACTAGDGWYMVGIRARVGLWFDSIGAVCARLQPDNRSFAGHKLTSMYGGQGGAAPKELVCGPTEVITRFTRYTNLDHNVFSVEFRCSDITTWVARNLVMKGSYGGGGGYANETCPYGRVGFGLNLAYGSYVNSASLMCAEFRNVPQTPPNPAVATLPNDPPRASTMDFGGTWRVQASNGATWDLKLVVANGKTVLGEFNILGQPQYRGTLSGEASSPGVLFFRWSQPKLAAGGEGSFVVYTNNTLRGNLNLGNPNTPLIAWKGVLRNRYVEIPGPAQQETPAAMPASNLATAVQATTVYKLPNSDQSANNTVCYIQAGDTGRVLGKGSDKWLNLGSVSGGCGGKSGWVWNDGELRLP